jgi:hypothetical protein
VEGIVLTIAGEPIRKATVTLRPLAGSPVPGSTLSNPYVTSSDAEGKFAFEKVEPGAYMLSAPTPWNR